MKNKDDRENISKNSSETMKTKQGGDGQLERPPKSKRKKKKSVVDGPKKRKSTKKKKGDTSISTYATDDSTPPELKRSNRTSGLHASEKHTGNSSNGQTTSSINGARRRANGDTVSDNENYVPVQKGRKKKRPTAGDRIRNENTYDADIETMNPSRPHTPTHTRSIQRSNGSMNYSNSYHANGSMNNYNSHNSSQGGGRKKGRTMGRSSTGSNVSSARPIRRSSTGSSVPSTRPLKSRSVSPKRGSVSGDPVETGRRSAYGTRMKRIDHTGAVIDEELPFRNDDDGLALSPMDHSPITASSKRARSTRLLREGNLPQISPYDEEAAIPASTSSSKPKNSSRFVFDTNKLFPNRQRVTHEDSSYEDPANRHSSWGHGGRGQALQKSKSTGSMLTVELEFGDEPKLIQFLRYIRVKAPSPNEKPIERKIRLTTWAALMCDFLAALVSITTFNGVAMCCGRPILSVMGNADWNTIVQVMTYIYMIMIFAEVLPVIRDGLPFNILNPTMGFLITFAVFFDDNVAEAATMWIIEATAVTCEALTYRLKMKVYNEKEIRVKEAEQKLKIFKAFKRYSRRKKKQQLARRLSGSSHGSVGSYHGSVGSHHGSVGSHHGSVGSHHGSVGSHHRRPPVRSLSGSSHHGSVDGTLDGFDDEEFFEANRHTFTPVREVRLLREIRVWKVEQNTMVQRLRYMFGGVVFNVVLVIFTLILISMISKNGGLCIVDFESPPIFSDGQLDRCYDCKGVEGTCEICREDGTSQCYYEYY